MPTIDDLLAEARAAIAPRVTAAELGALVDAGAVVVDTRPAEQRARDGDLPGAVVVDRNVLEWRIDSLMVGRKVVVVCDEGYSSSLAAATLRRLGVDATDLDGGFQAWLGQNR